MNRPSYKELWLYECKDRDEQLQWIRNAVNGNAKFCNSEPPYSEEEELARKIMQMHARIAELEAELDRRIRMPKDLWFQVAELSTRVNELEAAQRWIPVGERLPEDRVTILAAFNNREILTAKYYKYYEGFGSVENYWRIEGWHSGNVTHWMPLPESPEVQA